MTARQKLVQDRKASMMPGASPSTNLANATAADTMVDLTGMDFGHGADVYQRDLE